MLRVIFGPRRYEVTGGWRKLHNEELHEFGGACSTNGEEERLYDIEGNARMKETTRKTKT
jgi:hypothetical protein